MPYKCLNCGSIFDEPETINTSYESYYGVSGMFSNSTRMELDVCPCCNDDDITEFYDDEDEESEEDEDGN